MMRALLLFVVLVVDGGLSNVIHDYRQPERTRPAYDAPEAQAKEIAR